jgi:hypothetical protein
MAKKVDKHGKALRGAAKGGRPHSEEHKAKLRAAMLRWREENKEKAEEIGRKAGNSFKERLAAMSEKERKEEEARVLAEARRFGVKKVQARREAAGLKPGADGMIELYNLKRKEFGLVGAKQAFDTGRIHCPMEREGAKVQGVGAPGWQAIGWWLPEATTTQPGTMLVFTMDFYSYVLRWFWVKPEGDGNGRYVFRARPSRLANLTRRYKGVDTKINMEADLALTSLVMGKTWDAVPMWEPGEAARRGKYDRSSVWVSGTLVYGGLRWPMACNGKRIGPSSLAVVLRNKGGGPRGSWERVTREAIDDWHTGKGREAVKRLDDAAVPPAELPAEAAV